MDLDGVASKATPDLVAAISNLYPSFPQQWVDDRTRTLAVLYLLREKRPDLLLVLMVDLASVEDDQGPFEVNANAILERTDELIGSILDALPHDYIFVLVSDHGFERVDRTANPRILLKRNGVAGKLEHMGGIVTTTDSAVATFLRKAATDPANAIGRKIPPGELVQYAPRLVGVQAAFEPAEHVMFGPTDQGEYFGPAFEKGNHGFWPTRRDYRSVFLAYGPDITAKALPEMQIIDIAGKLAGFLGIKFPPAP